MLKYQTVPKNKHLMKQLIALYKTMESQVHLKPTLLNLIYDLFSRSLREANEAL